MKCKGDGLEADEVVYGGGVMDWRSSFSEREPSTIKKIKTEYSFKNMSRSRSRSRRARGTPLLLQEPKLFQMHTRCLLKSLTENNARHSQT